MDKNSTQFTLQSSTQPHRTAIKPAAETIAKIKQFARAYTFAATPINTLGNLVLN